MQLSRVTLRTRPRLLALSVSAVVAAVLLSGVVESGGATNLASSLTSQSARSGGGDSPTTGSALGLVELGTTKASPKASEASSVDAPSASSSEGSKGPTVTGSSTEGDYLEQTYTIMSAGNTPNFASEVTAWIGATGWVGGSSAGSQAGFQLVPTTTTLQLAAPSVPYASQDAESFNLLVSPAATGEATVEGPTGQLCSASIVLGSGTCSLQAGSLSAGTYAVEAQFTGTGLDENSQSETTNLVVNPTATSTSLALSSSSVPYGSEQSEDFSVTVSPSVSGSAAIQGASGALCTAVVTNGTGTCSPAADALSSGTQSVSAFFTGATDYAASTSADQTLTVTGSGTGTGTGGGNPNANVIGVYAGSGDPTAVSDFTTTLGAQPKFAMDFLNGTSWSTIDSPSWYLDQWKGKGYTMIWGVPMLPGSGSGATLAEGATGAYNQYFTTLASDFVAAGQGSSIIRIGWEFNGGWFPWAANGQATQFVEYYQQIVDAMRSVAGASFKFEWNPTRGDLGVGNLANYYPGDAYVDYIGLDVYDTEWGTYPGAQAEFQNMETEAYGLDWLASFAAEHNKQIVFPEWGLGWGDCSSGGAAISDPNNQVCGGDDPTFINDMSQWIATHNVYEANYWDYGTSSVDGGSNPNTAAALKADFG